ncbi:MAG: lipopolysaccharide biosynthesis protein [Nanobdellota archaeon]
MTTDQSLTQRAGRSALWQLAGGGWQTAVRLGASIFLARALTPAEFGIFGMALLFNELLNSIGALGMGAGVIARKKVTEEDLSTCFWSMAAMRVLVFLAAFAGAPLAGYFFNEPSLTEVIRAISFVFLISIFGVVSQTLLSKELRFRALNSIRGVTVLLESTLAVLLAMNTDLGYWALVIATLAQQIAMHTAIFFTVRWKPRFLFNRESFRYLFRYGINGLGFSITNYLKQNLDYLLVARLLGTQSLGLYEFAYRIPHLVLDRISRPVGAVVFPTLSMVQDDNSRLAQGYVKSVTYVCLVAFPLLFGLAAVADVAVPVLWGDQWLPIITPLRLLCLCAILRMVPQPLGAIFNCKNRPDLPFKISIVGLVWTALVVWILGYFYGLIGISLGMVLSVLPGYASALIAFRMLDVSLDTLFRSLKPILISATGSGLISYAFSNILQAAGLPLIGVLVLAVIAGALVYFIILYYVFPVLICEILQVLEDIVGIRLKQSWMKYIFKLASNKT